MRRGKARPPSTVASPCIKVCTFDESGEYCIGCKRTPEEMRDWYIMTDDEKNNLLEQLAVRQ